MTYKLSHYSPLPDKADGRKQAFVMCNEGTPHEIIRQIAQIKSHPWRFVSSYNPVPMDALQPLLDSYERNR